MLMVATSSKLDPTFRIVGELDALYEKKQQQYHGWHVQQDIKLAMSRFVRTTYYITLDADVFCGRKLYYNDFIDSDSNKAFTRSDSNKAYKSGNFNLTGLHLKISHPPVDDNTLMIGFTPIIFNTAVVKNLTNYFTTRERRPWLEYFMELHTPKSGDVTKIVWNVVDNSLSTTFFKSAMRYRFCPIIVLNVVLNFAMKVLIAAMIYMFIANKVIDNSMINITYA